MKVYIDQRASTFGPGGLRRYSRDLLAAFQEADIQLTDHWETADLYHDPTGTISLDDAAAVSAVMPLVVTLHDAIPYFMGKLNWEDTAPYVSRIQALSLLAMRIVTISHAAAMQLREVGLPSGKLSVIYPGIAKRLFSRVDDATWQERFREWGIPRGAHVVGAVMRFDHHKQLLFLLETGWWLKKQSTTPIALAILGIGEPGELWAENVHRLGLEETVTWVPHLSDADLAGFYSGCDCLISPSLIEGFGFPPLEALACGCPVVVSDIPVYRETLGEMATFIRTRKYRDAAQQIVRLLSNTELRNKALTAGPEHVLRYDWRQAALAYSEVFVAAIMEGSDSHEL